MKINFFRSFKNNNTGSRLSFKLLCMLFVFLYQFAHSSDAYEVYCNDPNSPDSYKGTWVARYNLVPSGYGPLIYITYLGYRDNAQSSFQEITSDQWDLEVDPWPLGAGLQHTQGWNTVIYGTSAGLFTDGRVTSPNGRCKIYLSSYTYPDSSITQTGPKAVLVGDSVTRGITDSLDKRTALARSFSSIGWRFQGEGYSGQHWQDSFDSQGNVVSKNIYDANGNLVAVSNYRDEIRGLLSTNPKAFVFELGTNDAVINAAHKLNPSSIPSYSVLRNSTVTNIVGVYNEANLAGRCLIFLTPTDYPTQALGLGQTYADEAKWMGDVIRFLFSNNSSVQIVDWASISRSHHLPDGTYGDWFPDGDEIHPNDAGKFALIGTIANAVQKCQ